ncbi:hypothetical protein [Synechococcus sp. CC9616]|nr:hypothetical protein [Synechococcus sp. CC9616]
MFTTEVMKQQNCIGFFKRRLALRVIVEQDQLVGVLQLIAPLDT